MNPGKFAHGLHPLHLFLQVPALDTTRRGTYLDSEELGTAQCHMFGLASSRGVSSA